MRAAADPASSSYRLIEPPRENPRHRSSRPYRESDRWACRNRVLSRPRTEAKNRRFSMTVRSPYRSKSDPEKPIVCLDRLCVTSPSEHRRKPARMRRRVDLPDPSAPMMDTKAPSSTSRSCPSVSVVAELYAHVSQGDERCGRSGGHTSLLRKRHAATNTTTTA
jgi:hypothetical protein